MRNNRFNQASFVMSRIAITALLVATSTGTFAGNEAEVIKQLAGAWSTSAMDKESGDVETTVIEFKSSGAYTTRFISKLFGEAKSTASGRYSILDATKDTFTLKMEVLKGDPEMDKANALIVSKIRQTDANTLQTEVGQILRRIK
jgi:hypothetical protein